MPLVSQRVVAIKDKDDFYHRVEIGIRHTVCEDEASEDCSGIVCTVDVDIASGRTTGRHVVCWISACRCFVVCSSDMKQRRRVIARQGSRLMIGRLDGTTQTITRLEPSVSVRLDNLSCQANASK